MLFKVSGTHKELGTDEKLLVECDSADEAIKRANALGYFVSATEPVGAKIEKPAIVAGETPSSDGVPILTVAVASALGIFGCVITYNTASISCVGLIGVFVGLLCVLGSVGMFIIAQEKAVEKSKLAGMSEEDQSKYHAKKAKRRSEIRETVRLAQLGKPSPEMVCPHCQRKGSVRTKAVINKRGVSGGKAAAALLTGGASVLVTGLSRKEKNTSAHCTNCANSWEF